MNIYPNKSLNFGTLHLYKPEKNYGGSDTTHLNHATQFFRYDDVDEFIVNYLYALNSKKPLNIISAGCSFGEEVYSYAMALEDLEQKPRIVGIDVSPKTICGAEKGEYMLDDKERRMLEINSPIQAIIPETPYQRELKSKFNRYFELTNDEIKEYRKADGTFENCEFICADLLDLDKMFEKNSQDVILCRHVLYHLSAQNRMIFLQQVLDILKPNGILCIEPFGHVNYDGILQKIGFVKPFPSSAKFIYSKPENKISPYEFIKLEILHNKTNFDNI